jgi:hypothetical protein
MYLSGNRGMINTIAFIENLPNQELTVNIFEEI